ncbi:MAG: hydrogen gas-evolving membrane-bound hydrogenase subunit E [Acidimicrobiales bacterium]
MIWWILSAHVVGMCAAALLGRVSMHRGLGAAAVAPALTAAWAAQQLFVDAEPTSVGIDWVAELGIGFQFRSGPLALLLTLLVSGIGALIFVYAMGYFASDAAGSVRFPVTLLAFSTSMLGLVLADSIWTLFIFWEFTSITSFLLVGHKNTSAPVQVAARRALAITGAGGLALLAGLLILQGETGTVSLSNLPAVSGTAGAVAAVLIMCAAATKSAQVPFHVWLPGAMAAPTPVSAYLHSATMVKAGVILVALTGPSFADVTAWKTLGMTFGIVSMMWGGFIALRHTDGKLILAWGTISQLGLLITLLSIGTPKAVFAAISILFAHALFKAALFCVVGEIDVRTGTRDVRELGGLRRSMPVAFAVAVAASLSMAGVPPLLGFAAKEAAVEAVLKLDGVEQFMAAVGVFGGSVLTVAYTLRFVLLTFSGSPVIDVRPRRWAMSAPSVILSGLGLILFFWMGVSNSVVIPAAVQLNPASAEFELLRWPGLKTAFFISAAIVATGALIGWLLANRPSRAPDALGADVVDSLLDRILRGAVVVTARIQHGSLPVYLATMAFVAAVAGAILVVDVDFDKLVLWDTPIQGLLAAIILGAVLGGATVRSRLGAALTLGAVGLAMAGLFALQGAPDLALTQLLVETIVIVAFVLGLGHLTREFPAVNRSWHAIRIAVAGAGGLVVVLALAAASASPTGQPPLEDLEREAVAEGGGNNIVNVILTDVRALDTLGEVMVLATVAIGILALANLRSIAGQR